MIEAFNKEPTGEGLETIKLEWAKVYISTNRSTEQFSRILERFGKLVKVEGVDTYLEKKRTQLDKVAKELEEMKKVVTEELVKKVPESVEVPDEYIDSFSCVPMEDPWMDNHGNTLDKSTWEKLLINPFTREAKDIKPNVELAKEIAQFKKDHPEVWKKSKGMEEA